MRDMLRTKVAGLMSALVLIVVSPAAAQCVESCTAIHTWVGEAAGDQFGWVSNNIGDIDLDGVNDLVLTAPTSGANGFHSGRIYVYSGQGGEELFRATGPAANWQFGHDAFTAGDLNGDGRPEIVVGAPGVSTGRVYVYTYDGNQSTVMHTFFGQVSGDQFGYRVFGGMDVDGDSVPDMVMGAPTHDSAGANAGRAYVVSGATFASICTLDGEQAGDLFGSGVALVGDLTGDARSEVLVGAPNAGSGGGLAYVFSYDGTNCSLEFPLAPPGPSLDFGLWFMNGGEDVDDDGTPDLYLNDYQLNRAYIYSGLDGSLLWTLTGDGNGQFGIGRLLEDINGDCHADILLAAWVSNNGAPSAGKAFVYSGIDGSILETFTHNVAGAGFGFDANGMGDVDGDGMYDHLITAASDLSSRGRAYLIAGNIQDGPCAETPLAAPAPHDIAKNRYISFKPRNAGRQSKLRVTLISSLPHPEIEASSWWVQAPIEATPGVAPKPLVGPDECVAMLGPEGTAAEIDWVGTGCQVLHVTGCPIEPTSEYEVEAVLVDIPSDPLSIATAARPSSGRWWGDTVGTFDGTVWTPPQGTTNIDDAVAAIRTWQGGAVVAPVGDVAHLSVTDIEPGDINMVVNFNDVLLSILAFQGEMYPFGPADANGNCP